jgi:hypothetical protein
VIEDRCDRELRTRTKNFFWGRGQVKDVGDDNGKLIKKKIEHISAVCS